MKRKTRGAGRKAGVPKEKAGGGKERPPATVIERIKRMSDCFRSLTADPTENIGILTSLCGELLGGACALYNRLEGEMLCAAGRWRTPRGYRRTDRAAGHICADVIREAKDDVVVIRNLPATTYARTDPNVALYGLKTYIGHAVKVGGRAIGALCVVYGEDLSPREEDTKIMGIIASAIGVEEEHLRAENALLESERRYRDFVENVNSIMLRMDSRRRITFVNRFAREFFGYSEEELLGKSVIGTIVPAFESTGRDLAKLMANICRDPDRFSNNENENIRKDGSVAWVAWTNRAVRDRRGRKTGVLCVGNDITRLKKAEEALRASEANYREIFDSANDAFFVHDIETGRILDLNRKTCDMFGYPARKIKKLTVADLSQGDPPYSQEDALRWIRRAAGGKAQLFQWLARDSTGRLFWVEVNLKKVEIGGRERILAIVRDVTERKRLESQLLQSQKMEAIGRLAGGVAHDFNNLLTAITGYSDLLLAGLGEKEDLRKDVMEIKKAAVKATSLTRQLMAFSRRQELKPKLLDLNAVVADIEKMLKRIIGENIELTSNLDPSLAAVEADRGQIEQVILNLVVNARDAMEGGGRLTIETRNRTLENDYRMAIPEARPGRFVCLSVADMGSGMNKKTMERIFDPFFSTKEPSRGAGLGLAICYGIVKQHGGWINAYSEVGRGSVFTIYLPAAEGRPEPPREKEPRLAELSGSGERVLVVEDDEAFREFATRTFSDNGYVCYEAASVREALDVFDAEGRKFQLVFADVALPDGDCSQLITKLLKCRADIPILLVSGYPERILRKTGITNGDYPFLRKPCSLVEILEAAKAALSGSAGRRGAGRPQGDHRSGAVR